VVDFHSNRDVTHTFILQRHAIPDDRHIDMREPIEALPLQNSVFSVFSVPSVVNSTRPLTQSALPSPTPAPSPKVLHPAFGVALPGCFLYPCQQQSLAVIETSTNPMNRPQF
jgi:hypothetical protein